MKDEKLGSIVIDAVLSDGQVKTRNQWVLPEECAIAIRLNGETYAVMLATPLDLEDFALGFCLSEGLIKSAGDVISITTKIVKDGIEVNVVIPDQALDRIQIIDRRRRLAGASGCGICGLTSLSHISENLPLVTGDFKVEVAAVQKALQLLPQHTPLNRANFSVHGAAFANERGEILMSREDVGRHNALDKLFGALASQQIDIKLGFVILTSRFAYEMAQKCIRLGVPIVVSISAPTSMAVDMAKAADMTFAAVAEGESLMIFSAGRRLI